MIGAPRRRSTLLRHRPRRSHPLLDPPRLRLQAPRVALLSLWLRICNSIALQAAVIKGWECSRGCGVEVLDVGRARPLRVVIVPGWGCRSGRGGLHLGTTIPSRVLQDKALEGGGCRPIFGGPSRRPLRGGCRMLVDMVGRGVHQTRGGVAGVEVSSVVVELQGARWVNGRACSCQENK